MFKRLSIGRSFFVGSSNPRIYKFLPSKTFFRYTSTSTAFKIPTQKDIEIAEQKFSDDLKNGSSEIPNRFVNLLLSYSASQNFKKADELFQQMPSFNLPSPKIPYHIMLHSYYNQGDTKKFGQLFRKILKDGHASEITKILYLKFLIKKGRLAEAEDIVSTLASEVEMNKESTFHNSSSSNNDTITTTSTSTATETSKEPSKASVSDRNNVWKSSSWDKRL